MKILVKNAKVVCAEKVEEKNIYIQDEKFVKDFGECADQIIDAKGNG